MFDRLRLLLARLTGSRRPVRRRPTGTRSEAARIGRIQFRVLLVAFCALGFHVGVWAVLLSDLANAVGLTPMDLGIALGAMTGTGIVALTASGNLADRHGRRPILVLGTAGTGALFLILANTGTYAVLLAAFIFGGVSTSLWDLAVNALGGDHERLHNSKVMTPLHAGFSGGAAAGALLSGVVLAAGLGFAALYTATGAALLSLAAAMAFLPLPDRPESVAFTERDAAPARRVAGLGAVFLGPTALVGAIIFMSYSTDASLEGFLSIYLRDVLGSGVLLGGTGLAALYFTGMVGRLISSGALRRLSERTLLLIAGVVAALGMGAVVATDSPAVAAAALLMVGAAGSPVAPIAFSLTARGAPEQSARAVAVVTIFGYVAFTVSPPVVGVLADASSLKEALALLVAFYLGIALVSWFLPAKLDRE